MGQYWINMNEDRKEYIKPHTFGDGAQLMDFAVGEGSILTGLTLLLADKTTNGRGDGDFFDDNENDVIVGRWHGGRIKIVGDYGDDGLYDMMHTEGIDISQQVLRTMIKNKYVKEIQEKCIWSPLGKRLNKEGE